jgi:hypothetical protein
MEIITANDNVTKNGESTKTDRTKTMAKAIPKNICDLLLFIIVTLYSKRSVKSSVGHKSKK